MKLFSLTIKTLLFVLILFNTTRQAYSQRLSGEYSTNGTNSTVLEKDGKLYVGGNFTEIGKSAQGLACVDLLNGKFIPGKTFRSDYYFSTIITDDKGGYFIGGYFNYLNDTATESLAHIRNDGSIDQAFKFNVRTQYGYGIVKSLYKMGDTLFVVGFYDSVNGKVRGNIAGINLKNNALMDWAPVCNDIRSVAFNKDHVFLGGNFKLYNDRRVSNFVKLNRNDLSYVYSVGYDGIIDKLLMDSTKVIAKGNYSMSGWPNPGLIYIDTANPERTFFGFQLNGYVSKMKPDPKGGWFMAGNFTVDNYPAIKNLLRLKSDHTLDTMFKFNFNQAIIDIAIVDSLLFCASENVVVNGKAYDHIAIINHVNQKLVNNPITLPMAPVRYFDTYRKDLIVKTINELLRFRLPGLQMQDVPLGDLDVKVDSNYLYLNSGQGYISWGSTNITQFRNNGRISRNRAKQYLTECNAILSDGNGGWYIAGNGVRHILADGTLDDKLSMEFQMGSAECLLKRGDTLFVGGSFQNIKSQSSSFFNYLGNLAIINIKTGAIGSFVSQINKQSPNYNDGNVKQMTLVGDSLILAGYIRVTGNSTYQYFNNAAKLSLVSYTYSSYAPNFDGTIYNVYQVDSFIYYGGFFKTVNGAKRNGLCRFNKYTSLLDAWQPAIDSTSMIHEITADDSFVYAACRTMDPATYAITQYLVRVHKRTGAQIPYGNELDSGFSSFSTFGIQTLQTQNDTLFVMGSFQRKIGSKTYSNGIKANKKTGVVYPFDIRIGGPIQYFEPLSSGQYVVGGLLNDIEKQDKVILSRYDLDNNFLDTWKVNKQVAPFPIGKVAFDINRNSIYFASPGYNNTTIDGITRNVIFKANKNDGAITAFNAKIPYLYYGIGNIKCINNQVYMYTNLNGANYLYKMMEGKDSHRLVTFYGGSYLAVETGAGNMPFITGNFLMYNNIGNARSLNGYTNLFEKGMNYYPGTFTQGSTSSSVYYNDHDSVYYLYEGGGLNKLGEYGNIYRVRPKTGEVTKLDFFGPGMNDFYRKDSVFMVFGQFSSVYTKGSYKPVANIFKFNERKNEVDFAFRPGLNDVVNGVLVSQDNMFVTGDFQLVNKESRTCLGVIDLQADTITAYAPDPNGTVRKIISYDTAIIIAGNFFSTRYGTAGAMAILDTRAGKVIHNFGISGVTLSSLLRDGDKLYLGGSFTNLKGSGINNLVRYDLKTRTIDNWDAKVTGAIYRLADDDSCLYVAGEISNIGTNNQLYYGRVKKDNAANITPGFQLKAPNGEPSYSGSASGLVVTDNLVYVGGYFELDNKRKGIIAIDKKTNQPTSYKVDIASITSNDFNDVAQYDDKLIVPTHDALNGFISGNVMMVDRYQSISYPRLPGNGNVIGGVFDLSVSDNAIYGTSSVTSDGYLINQSRVGNLLVIEKDTTNSHEHISVFTPGVSGNKGKVTIRIKGNKFSDGDVVYLVRNKDTIWCKNINVIDRNMLIAGFDFNNDSVGNYGLHIKFSMTGKTIAHETEYKLVPVGLTDIRTSVIGYDRVRGNRWFDYLLKVENKTNVDLDNVPVYLSVETNGQVILDARNTYGDTFLYTYIDTLDNRAQKNSIYSFMIPKLGTAQIYSIPFQLKVAKGDSLSIYVWNQLPLNNDRKLRCLGQVWKKFSGNSLGLSCIQKSLFKVDSSFSNSMDFEFGGAPAVADYHQFYTNTTSYCKSSYSAAQLSKINKYFANPVYMAGIDSICLYKENKGNVDSSIMLPVKPSKLRIRVINSLDPNDKIGPMGEGNDNMLSDLPGTFNYVVRFENASSASAPAQKIVIRDTIDKKYFDIRTVSFNSFKVGDYKYFFASGTSKINRNFDFRDKASLVLNLTTEVDTAQGIISWTFTSLDVQTLTTEKLNPLYGFLPPNDQTNRGQGSVSFDITVWPGIGESADIRNRADIVFDDNKSILTPYWRIVRDNVPPTSKVLPLPSEVQTISFPVSWQGSDQFGISRIEVFASSNNIVYSLWRTSLSDSSATYTGKKDSTYYFYSIATDHLGNREAIPGTFDASTLVRPVSIQNVFAAGSYKLYPNPGNGLLNLVTDGQHELVINIYTIEGKLVGSLDCEGTETKFFINQKGVFIIEIKSGNEVVGIDKVIVE